MVPSSVASTVVTDATMRLFETLRASCSPAGPVPFEGKAFPLDIQLGTIKREYDQQQEDRDIEKGKDEARAGPGRREQPALQDGSVKLPEKNAEPDWAGTLTLPQTCPLDSLQRARPSIVHKRSQY